MSQDIVESAYEHYLQTTRDPQAAALLCVASALMDIAKSTKALTDDSLGHEICMGIRHGLFGANASSSHTIAEVADSVAEAIKQHGEAE
ncbi:MAG: hypothetical protein K2W85_17000 [Phycisphaerales bacterium]|nr:hypothetical protein [Phycisphaerales bacterium]